MTGLRTATLLALTLATPALLRAQSAAHAPDERAGRDTAAFQLTIREIMRGPELVGSPPEQVRWTIDGRWVYFRWNPGGRAWHEEPALYRVPASGGEPQRIATAEADSLGALIAGGPLSPDRRRRAVAWQGDLWLIPRDGTAPRRLTRTREEESSPAWSRDGRTLYFVRSDNLYSMALDGGALEQLTDIRVGPKPQEETDTLAQRASLQREQLRLFEHLRLEKARRDSAEARKKAREAAERQTVWLEAGERLLRIEVEPAARYAVMEVGKEAQGTKSTIVPDWITTSGYTETISGRTKVGDRESEGRMGLVSISTGAVTWLDLAPAPKDSAVGGRERLAETRFVGWNPAGTTGLIVATSFDYKDRWIHTLDARTGTLTLVAHDHDDAWLDGPCFYECVGWMPDGASVFFASERDGFAHIYTAAAGGVARQLTSGRWEVYAAAISADRKGFDLLTNEGSPYEQHFWRMGLNGGKRTRITTEPGLQEVTPSPDGRRLAIVHSSSNRPPELYIADARPGAAMRRVTHSPTAAWERFGWIEPEIVEFTARDGAKVPARIYRPRDLGASPNGAGVIFVHGAGYLQNVTRGWSTYYREYMFHHLLARSGFTVLDVDYRGSAGYGRDWRTAVYRHMGGQDLDDIVDGARYLAASEGVDRARIGLYGGSYGGFITLMALFTRPKDFAAGAALRAVTDWAHYNHWYTSRILNLPQGDTTAYRQSSPIYFAEGLEDPLLIAHGMVDTNVQFQDVVRLSQRLIELGKTDWEMAVYPVENHAFVEPASWSDEYRRIFELFEHNLARPMTASEDR